MSLHNGIDLMAVASHGVYSATYGSANRGAIANLFASLGLLEDAPESSPGVLAKLYGMIKRKMRKIR